MMTVRRNLAFVACELKSLVNVYYVDELTGALNFSQQVQNIVYLGINFHLSICTYFAVI